MTPSLNRQPSLSFFFLLPSSFLFILDTFSLLYCCFGAALAARAKTLWAHFTTGRSTILPSRLKAPIPACRCFSYPATILDAFSTSREQEKRSEREEREREEREERESWRVAVTL